MKTRKQAEARAIELFPKVPIHSQHYVTNQIGRKAFLQCWEEMQQDKQTCGFCVEPKEEQKELLSEMMRKDEEDGLYDYISDDEHKDYRNGVREVVKYLLNAQPTDDEEVIDNYTDSIVSNNQLREEDGVYGEFNLLLTVKQAESICIGFYNDLVRHLESGLSAEMFHGEIVFNKHLNKALK